MNEMLGLDIGPAEVRAAVVTNKGFLTRVVRVPARSGHAEAAKQAAGQLGAPHDMWAVAAVTPAPSDRRRGDSRSDDRDVHGLSTDRLGALLGRPVIVHDEQAVSAAGEAWFGAGEGRRRVAVLNVGTMPRWTLLIHGQVTSSISRPMVSPSMARHSALMDPREVLRISSQVAVAIIEEHEPDALVLAGASDEVLDHAMKRVTDVQERRGPSLPHCLVSKPILGADAALRGCAIWPSASGAFGGSRGRQPGRPLPQW